MDFKKQIRAQALSDPGREICGFITKKGMEPKENVSTSPGDSFVISFEDFLDTKDIEYIYHSHPKSSSTPSRADKMYCSEIQIPFVIYSIPNDDFYVLAPSHHQVYRERGIR